MTRLKLLAIVFIASVLAITRPDLKVAEMLRPISNMEKGAAQIKKNWRRIVKITPPTRENAGGTGFSVITPSGSTVTVSNAHVCEVAENGQVAARWDNGRYTLLNVLEVDKDHDLCVMQGLPGEIGGLSLGWNDAQVSDVVYVIGHPLLYPNTYSEGIVRERTNIDLLMELDPEDKEFCMERGWKYIESITAFGIFTACVKGYDSFGMTTKIFPGNSGSPVFNQRDEVIGVVFAGDSRTGDGSYIPLEYLERILASY